MLEGVLSYYASAGRRVVDVSAEDWAAIQETLYLISVPGMRESIQHGLRTALDEYNRELIW